MTDDLAQLAANDQYAAEMAERITRATMDAGAIAAFYRCLKEDGVTAALLSGLTHKFADWYFAADTVPWPEDLD